MSITKDIRTYADTAFGQGKHVLDQAQAQLTEVSGQANQVVGKLREAYQGNVATIATKAGGSVTELRVQAEKAVNLDAVKAAIEPYLAQAKGYTTSVTERAEGLILTVRNDKRVVRIVATAESLTGVVVETVQGRVVKPVFALTGRGAKSTTAPVAGERPRAASTTKPAATRPATKAGASKVTARKAPAKKAPAEG